MRIFFMLLLFFLSMPYVGATPQNTYPFTSAEETNRFQQLTQEIRCVVCQNQNIADSNAPIASDMRKKIYTLINTGKSDAEIRQYLVDRYGDFILLRPPVKKLTILLWAFPLLALLLIPCMLYRFFKPKSV